MREYKFRGRDEHGVWHYGDLLSWPIIRSFNGWNYEYQEVEEDTVGQYTGLKDADGREIYEGDIVKATLKDKSFVKRFHMDGTVTGKISFDGAWWLGEWDALWRLPRYYDLTVIGNIYDNPELLKLTKK